MYFICGFKVLRNGLGVRALEQRRVEREAGSGLVMAGAEPGGTKEQGGAGSVVTVPSKGSSLFKTTCNACIIFLGGGRSDSPLANLYPIIWWEM